MIQVCDVIKLTDHGVKDVRLSIRLTASSISDKWDHDLAENIGQASSGSGGTLINNNKIIKIKTHI